jgi:hypothetical protein
MAMPGRNDPCPCGSGKKFKKCCIDTYQDEAEAPAALTIDRLAHLVNEEMEWENELYRLQALHFLDKAKERYPADALWTTLEFWNDFSGVDEPTMKKFGAFSAALEYFTASEVGAHATQAEIAARYGVSSATLSKRYNELMDYAAFVVGFHGEDDEDNATPSIYPEQMYRDIERLLAEQQIETMEEAKAFVDDYLSKQQIVGLPGGRPSKVKNAKASSPKDEAQDLLYEAMDEPSSAKRVKLAKEALRIHPDSPDAYSILGEEAAAPVEAKSWFLRGMEAGERDLGKRFFEENEGFFWGLHETRPYMRAKYSYAELCWYTEDLEEARKHLEHLLQLQPGDSLGARYLLVALYLHTNRTESAEWLLKKYDEESAFFQYDRMVMEYKKKGLTAKLKLLYRNALQANPHVPKLMLGKKQLPEGLPEYYGVGDEDEAVHYVTSHALLWVGLPELVQWVHDQM